MVERILVVGGTSGIGLATARYLTKINYHVTVSGSRQFRDDSLPFFQCDVRSESSVKTIADQFIEQGLDGLVYSVGITKAKASIEEFDKKSWQEIMDVNVTGALLCLKYFLSPLRKASGSVVVVNSLAGRARSPLSGFEYTMSKYALRGMVNQLAPDLIKQGVRINSVFPSMTATPMLKKNVSSQALAEIEKSIPVGRIADTEDISRAIAFLLDKKNRYVVGAGLDVSGGLFLNG